MGKILVVGLGPGSEEMISLGVLEKLKNSPNVILRTEIHPIVEKFSHWGISYQSMDGYYQANQSFAEVYQAIIEVLIQEARKKEEVVYAVPGSPLIAETTVELLKARALKEGIEVEILPALSFLDAIYPLIRIDPIQGLQIIDGLNLKVENINTNVGLLICQVYSRLIASEVKLDLLQCYEGDLEITVIKGAGLKESERVERLPLYQLDHLNWIDHLTTVYIPPAPRATPLTCRYPLDPLTQVMDKLLGPEGCPWDRKQDHKSLKPYLIEESYEVIEAIDNGNMYKLCEELGDLLLQVVFHGKLAEEQGDFDLNQVIEVITEKMVRRHPHVFAGLHVNGTKEVLNNWEMIKAQEKGNNVEKGLLDKVPRGLSPLIQAFKLQEKAATVGFDWSDLAGPWNKVFEELEELNGAIHTELGNNRQERIALELGDVLFALVNLSRFLKVSPEDALFATIRKFRLRFAFIEEQVKGTGKDIKEFTLEELDYWWSIAKNQENKK